MKIQIQKSKNKILGLSFALKDAIGVFFLGIPLRFSEFILFSSTILNFTPKRKIKIARREIIFITILFINLIFCIFTSICNYQNISHSFFMKYVARNFYYLFVLTLFFINGTVFEKKDVESLFKSVLLVNILAFAIQYLFGARFYICSIIDTDLNSFGTIYFNGVRFVRFFGTASEPGYLGTILIMPFHYYLNIYIEKKEKLFEVIILSLLIILTVSASAYLFCALSILITFIKTKKIWNKIFYLIFFLILILIVYYVLIHNSEIFNVYQTLFFRKVKSFFGVSSSINDFSGMDRNQHITRCINMFFSEPLVNIIFGIGTGGYANTLNNSKNLLLEAEEAYNIYLSTLLDRGLIGFICLLASFFIICKYYKSEDKISSSLFLGIVCQYLHWNITGNMWLCSYWIQVLYLIGYSKGKH